MTSVNPGRRYSSALREQQAATTRTAVIDAATRLFIERGYGATTIEQIAARAGVSKPTVFAAVGNKQAVLAAVRDVAIAGDDDPTPIAARPSVAAIIDEPDQHKAVVLIAAHLTAVAQRYARIHEVVRGAAASGEQELTRLWNNEEHQRLLGARHWIEVLAAKAPLRDDLDPATAADIMWLLMAPDNYARLVHDRGWSARRYQRWLIDSISALCAGGPEEPIQAGS
jgi:AcrR family transcriptional regulator